MSPPPRKPYPTDVTDDEWWFLAPYLALVRGDAGQRVHDPREVPNAIRYLVKSGGPWRLVPNDLPPWPAVYQQARRWLAAGSFEAAAHDRRELVRLASGRTPAPIACVPDGRTVQSTPGSGGRAGYDGYKRGNGSEVPMAVDTLGLPLALRATAAGEQERHQVYDLAAAAQEATGQTAALADVDRGYTGTQPAADAAAHGIELEVVKLRGPARGSCWCPAGGWSSGRSGGWPGSGAWPWTTSGPRTRSPAGTGSRSSASCSTGTPRY